jgi:hypothetical protein
MGGGSVLGVPPQALYVQSVRCAVRCAVRSVLCAAAVLAAPGHRSIANIIKLLRALWLWLAYAYFCSVCRHINDNIVVRR